MTIGRLFALRASSRCCVQRDGASETVSVAIFPSKLILTTSCHSWPAFVVYRLAPLRWQQGAADGQAIRWTGRVATVSLR